MFVNSIYVHHFEGMSVEESQDLLEFLYTESTRPEYSCRFRWKNNSVAFWDNRCVQHVATDDFLPLYRRMERVTIAGDRPF